MGSASRVHKPKKGKGSYARNPKHVPRDDSTAHENPCLPVSIEKPRLLIQPPFQGTVLAQVRFGRLKGKCHVVRAVPD